MIPIRTFRQKGYQNLNDHDHCGYKAVSKPRIKKALIDLHQQVYYYNKCLLKSKLVVSSTTVLQNCESSDSYASLTVSFIDPKQKFKSIVLICTKLATRHTGDEISKFILKEAQKYGIEKKISLRTTDAAKMLNEMSGSVQHKNLFCWTLSIIYCRPMMAPWTQKIVQKRMMRRFWQRLLQMILMMIKRHH